MTDGTTMKSLRLPKPAC